MRTFDEILNDVESGKMPNQEELYFALLVMKFLHHMDSSAMRRLAYEPPCSIRTPHYLCDESFRRMKSALATDPQKYIGRNDPRLPEFQERRGMALKLFSKVCDKQEREAREGVMSADQPHQCRART